MDHVESQVITCPSGLSGLVRGMKVREERILADRRLAKTGQQMDALLGACWVETHHSGPYDFAGGPPKWGQVLQGDRFYALLQIRALTYGDEYAFSVQCQNDACARRIQWTVGLDELPKRDLPEAHREQFAAGNSFAAKLPVSGKQAWFRLATGDDERKLTALRETQKHRMLSAILALRIVEVEGLAEADKRAFLEDLPLRDAHHLMAQFESVDCGVQTAIDIECPHCLAAQSVDLPLDPSFLWPRPKADMSRVSQVSA